MSAKDMISIVSWILCMALVPESFLGAFWIIRKWVKSEAAVVLLTIVLGGIFMIAGVVAVLAGCASVTLTR